MYYYLYVGLAFGAGFLLVFGINLLLVDVFEASRQRAQTRLAGELRTRQRERARGSLDYKELYELAAEGIGDASVRATPRERFVRFVDQSGLLIRPGHLVGLCFGMFLLPAVAVRVLAGSWSLAAIAAVIGGVLPLLYVAGVRASRLAKLLGQLPDAFDLMSRTMRAGQTVSQAMQAVADEFSPPIADEFGYCYDQQNLGLSPEAALRDLARRTGLLELKIFVLAVTVHRQAGGNLADLLEKLATVIRDRARIRGAIKALTAEGRMQAVILMALPVFMLCAMLVLNRPYAMVLFQYPVMLAAVFASMTVGGIFMHRIVSFDF